MDNATLIKIADNLEYMKAVSVRIGTDASRTIYAKTLEKVSDLIREVVTYETLSRGTDLSNPLPARPNEKDQFTLIVRTLRSGARLLSDESDKSQSTLPAEDRALLETLPKIRQNRF